MNTKGEDDLKMCKLCQKLELSLIEIFHKEEKRKNFKGFWEAAYFDKAMSQTGKPSKVSVSYDTTNYRTIITIDHEDQK